MVRGPSPTLFNEGKGLNEGPRTMHTHGLGFDYGRDEKKRGYYISGQIFRKVNRGVLSANWGRGTKQNFFECLRLRVGGR